MRYFICLTSKSEFVYPLLKRKIEQSKFVELKKSGVKIDRLKILEVKVSDGVADLASILAEIIVENIQLRHLIGLIDKKYSFLEEGVQCDILIKTLRLLWFSKKKKLDGYTITKIDIEQRIIKYFMEADKNLIILDGFVDFRLNDYLTSWKNTLKKVVHSYILEKDYRDFIGILRYFVSIKKPVKSIVNLKYEKGRYILSDENGNMIDYKEYERKIGMNHHMTTSDLVLSMLVNLAPKRILLYDYKKFPDKKFILTVKNVFLKRVCLKEAID